MTIWWVRQFALISLRSPHIQFRFEATSRACILNRSLRVSFDSSRSWYNICCFKFSTTYRWNDMTKNRLAMTIQRSHKTFDKFLFSTQLRHFWSDFDDFEFPGHVEPSRTCPDPRSRDQALGHVTGALTTRLRTRWVWRSEKDRLRVSLFIDGDITGRKNFFRADARTKPFVRFPGNSVEVWRASESTRKNNFFGSEKFRSGARRVSEFYFRHAIAPEPSGLRGCASHRRWVQVPSLRGLEGRTLRWILSPHGGAKKISGCRGGGARLGSLWALKIRDQSLSVRGCPNGSAKLAFMQILFPSVGKS